MYTCSVLLIAGNVIKKKKIRCWEFRCINLRDDALFLKFQTKISDLFITSIISSMTCLPKIIGSFEAQEFQSLNAVRPGDFNVCYST